MARGLPNVNVCNLTQLYWESGTEAGGTAWHGCTENVGYKTRLIEAFVMRNFPSRFIARFCVILISCLFYSFNPIQPNGKFIAFHELWHIHWLEMLTTKEVWWNSTSHSWPMTMIERYINAILQWSSCSSFACPAFYAEHASCVLRSSLHVNTTIVKCIYFGNKKRLIIL